MQKYICIHGHFYQPPRENPWLESLELQDSASPYHDWNERITMECYAPNSAARIMDGANKINEITNNYSKISFNFGPTLLSWMKENMPEIHESIVAADKLSQSRYGGHGSALAQVYNHMILPLANARDRHTQVLWGIRDFESRFGRPPEGMWLSETAADTPTLETLAELGIRFTILSPFQASRVKEIGKRNSRDVNGGQIDPTRPYLVRLPSGRSITVFFYDGPVSRAIAFEALLGSGEALAGRLTSAFNDRRQWDQLVHIATDGESYGHHHRHGEMALAFALDHIEKNNWAKLTNYGEFLETHPPTHEAQIHEKSAWSCVHGVGRWMNDCGCNSGGHPG
jgi:alpha-amylase/alpha-mannosidase (GH57 family)